MCVTNIYVDRWPDGREIEYRNLSACEKGSPGHPCPIHSTLENPVRNIQFGEPTTEYMFTQNVLLGLKPSVHSVPYLGRPQSRETLRRTGSDGATNEAKLASIPRATRRRQARYNENERIVIVDPLPGITASSTLPYQERHSAPGRMHQSRRPIIVDEHVSKKDVPSGEAALGSRYRERTRTREKVDHLEERLTGRYSLSSVRGASYIDDGYQRRQNRRNGRLEDETVHIVESERGDRSRRGGTREAEEVDLAALQQKAQEAELEALQQRLRERQMPLRRFSTGPGQRRLRVTYNNDVYHWEGGNSETLKDRVRHPPEPPRGEISTGDEMGINATELKNDKPMNDGSIGRSGNQDKMRPENTRAQQQELRRNMSYGIPGGYIEVTTKSARRRANSTDEGHQKDIKKTCPGYFKERMTTEQPENSVAGFIPGQSSSNPALDSRDDSIELEEKMAGGAKVPKQLPDYFYSSKKFLWLERQNFGNNASPPGRKSAKKRAKGETGKGMSRSASATGLSSSMREYDPSAPSAQEYFRQPIIPVPSYPVPSPSYNYAPLAATPQPDNSSSNSHTTRRDIDDYSDDSDEIPNPNPFSPFDDAITPGMGNWIMEEQLPAMVPLSEKDFLAMATAASVESTHTMQTAPGVSQGLGEDDISALGGEGTVVVEKQAEEESQEKVSSRSTPGLKPHPYSAAATKPSDDDDESELEELEKRWQRFKKRRELFVVDDVETKKSRSGDTQEAANAVLIKTGPGPVAVIRGSKNNVRRIETGDGSAVKTSQDLSDGSYADDDPWILQKTIGTTENCHDAMVTEEKKEEISSRSGNTAGILLSGKGRSVTIDMSDYESEISADDQSTFSASDSISSQSSLGHAIGAPDELISLLTAHEDLKLLLEKASQSLDSSEFKENFAALLRKFASDLNKEAEQATEVLAVNLVRHSRRRVAYAIWRSVYGFGCGKSIAGALDHTRLDKARRLDETLKRLNQSEGHGPPDGRENDNQEEDSSEDDEVLQRLPNLEQVKIFLVNGLAFKKFLRRFEILLQSKSEKLNIIDEDEEHMPMSSFQQVLPRRIAPSSDEDQHASVPSQQKSMPEIASRAWKKLCLPGSRSWGQIYRDIDRLLRPRVSPGYRRLEWEMECGTWLYDDYDNSDPVHLEQFYHELTSSEVQDSAQQSPQGGASNSRGPPSLTSSSTSSSIVTMQSTSSSTSASSTNTSISSRPSTSIPSTSLVTPPPVTPLVRKFFAICVNTGSNLATLGEIDVSSIDHDGEWFSKMWAEYDRLRGFRSRLFRGLLIKPVDVKYVQFTVEEHQRADISFDPPIIPPPGEVAARNYEYTPCPLTFRPSPQTFLHYRSCATCTASREKKKRKHSSRLPKKLSRGLLDVYLRAGPDEDVLGWGVLIVEGPNKSVITLLSAAMLTLSVSVAVLYTALAKDTSSGFTIGSFVVAVWVSWMTAFYYHAKET